MYEASKAGPVTLAIRRYFRVMRTHELYFCQDCSEQIHTTHGMGPLLDHLKQRHPWTMRPKVKAANAAEGFTGEDGLLSARLQTKNMVVATNASADDFDLSGVFTSLASDDLYRAIELAKTFAGETARANATIAVARSVLEQKQQRVASTQ